MYTYRVQYSVEDSEFVATVAEFPSLSWLAETPGEALSGALVLVSDVIADMRANGETVPAPLAERSYSGRFMVRIPPEAHRRLVLDAAEQNISLNRLASRRLVAA
jgi:predicted RNase H-like HicB family nuclease